jgi:hypothetical protein
MNSLVRLLLCFVAVSGVTAGVLSLQPVWLASVGLDLWNLPELQRQIERGRQRNLELERYGQGVLQRLEAKRETIVQLSAGRIRLPEAVAHFRFLNEQSPPALEVACLQFPAATVDESIRLQVLSWTEAHLDTTCPQRKAEVLAQIEK